MDIYIFIVLYVLVFSIFVYGLFFANVESKGLNGKFSRLLLHSVPGKTKAAMKAVFGNACFGVFQRGFNYVVNERNPLLQGTYLIIINGAFIGWLLYGVPQLPTYYASTIHIYGGYFGVIVSQVTFFLACSIGPGSITKHNLKCYAHQPYDGLLFTSGLYCTTCKIEKVCRKSSQLSDE